MSRLGSVQEWLSGTVDLNRTACLQYRIAQSANLPGSEDEQPDAVIQTRWGLL